MSHNAARLAQFVHLFLFALIDRWPVQALPPDWVAIRDRWQAYHTSRTLASLT
jgi:hypothetical protein